VRIARLAFLLACLLGAFASRAIASDAQAAYRHVEVPGHGGVPLNVVEAGDPAGEPVLLLHGFSQSYLSWKLQLDDPVLRARFRLIAIDLRGHGGSGKPWDPAAYAGHLPWAEDIRRVLDALGVKANEKITGFVHIGRPAKPPDDRPRPPLADIVTRYES
jgi:alpha-beta hydrolase superfamily lysophospholipase